MPRTNEIVVRLSDEELSRLDDLRGPTRRADYLRGLRNAGSAARGRSHPPGVETRQGGNTVATRHTETDPITPETLSAETCD
jgi:hypothetical protein